MVLVRGLCHWNFGGEGPLLEVWIMSLEGEPIMSVEGAPRAATESMTTDEGGREGERGGGMMVLPVSYRSLHLYTFLNDYRL